MGRIYATMANFFSFFGQAPKKKVPCGADLGWAMSANGHPPEPRARGPGTQLPEIEISWAQKLLLKTGPSSGPGRRRITKPAIRKRGNISAFEGMGARHLPEPGGNRGIGIPRADFAKTATKSRSSFRKLLSTRPIH